MSWLRNTSDSVTRGGETGSVFYIAGLIFFRLPISAGATRCLCSVVSRLLPSIFFGYLRAFFKFSDCMMWTIMWLVSWALYHGVFQALLSCYNIWFTSYAITFISFASLTMYLPTIPYTTWFENSFFLFLFLFPFFFPHLFVLLLSFFPLQFGYLFEAITKSLNVFGINTA